MLLLYKIIIIFYLGISVLYHKCDLTPTKQDTAIEKKNPQAGEKGKKIRSS